MFQIQAPHFIAGGTWDEHGFVETAAPIIKYMIGWSDKRVSMYCRKKGWRVIPLPYIGLRPVRTEP